MNQKQHLSLSLSESEMHGLTNHEHTASDDSPAGIWNLKKNVWIIWITDSTALHHLGHYKLHTLSAFSWPWQIKTQPGINHLMTRMLTVYISNKMVLVTYTVPQPSSPRLWNMVTQNWKKKTKKNMKKLNELSLLKSTKYQTQTCYYCINLSLSINRSLVTLLQINSRLCIGVLFKVHKFSVWLLAFKIKNEFINKRRLLTTLYKIRQRFFGQQNKLTITNSKLHQYSSTHTGNNKH